MSGTEVPLLAPSTDAACPGRSSDERESALMRRARLLAGAGIAWHVVEAAVAVAAGVVAGSIALVGFGADSVVESLAGLVVIWRFAAGRRHSPLAELHAQRLIGASFAAIGIFVAADALRCLLGGSHPGSSPVGIALAVVTLVTMPLLARAKARVGLELGSAATVGEGRQNLLCAYLSAGLLVGLGANAAFGWWWADPLTGLAIAAVALKEGRAAWRGDACDCC